MTEPTAQDLDSMDVETAMERARDNPLWREAVSRVQAVPAIRVFYHMGRLNEALLFVGEMIQLQAQARNALIRA
jgi:hypothetical protein